jgi:5-methylcytosine-specific restriction endonuclease McrA
VNLSTLSMIWKHITPTLLERICNKSKKETELILSEFDAAIILKDRIKPVVVERPVAQRDDDGARHSTTKCKDIYRRSGGKLLAGVEDSTPGEKQTVEKEKVTMHEVRCYVDDEVMRQLERCKILLSSKYPQGLDYNRLLRELSTEWLNRHDLSRKAWRRNAAGASRGSASAWNTNDERSRHIPANIKRAVYKRDKGRCAYVGSNGKRCNSEHNLEFDHYPVPYARGGPSTANNLRLLCAKHNKHAAIKTYGERAIKKHFVKETKVGYLSAA